MGRRVFDAFDAGCIVGQGLDHRRSFGEKKIRGWGWNGACRRSRRPREMRGTPVELHAARAQKSAAAAVGLCGGSRAGSSGMYG